MLLGLFAYLLNSPFQKIDIIGGKDLWVCLLNGPPVSMRWLSELASILKCICRIVVRYKSEQSAGDQFCLSAVFMKDLTDLGSDFRVMTVTRQGVSHQIERGCPCLYTFETTVLGCMP